MEKTQIREYFTLHRIILLVIIAFLIYLFVYYNIKYKKEKKDIFKFEHNNKILPDFNK